MTVDEAYTLLVATRDHPPPTPLARKGRQRIVLDRIHTRLAPRHWAELLERIGVARTKVEGDFLGALERFLGVEKPIEAPAGLGNPHSIKRTGRRANRRPMGFGGDKQ